MQKDTANITIGIVGGAGYTAGELLRILAGHPQAEVKFVYSTSSAGSPVSAVHGDLLGETDLRFTDTLTDVDVLFLCLGHGLSADFLQKNSVASRTKVIDLGNDFRVTPTSCGARSFTYGLPEVFRGQIRAADNVANPGCFATAIQLALLPLAQGRLLQSEVHVTAITGSTGAGRSLSESGHFSYRSGNLAIYKPFVHQHLGEIEKTLTAAQGGSIPPISLIPVRGCFTRGIFATLYTECSLSAEEAERLYETFYKDHPFTFVLNREVSLKEVINTNKCFLRVQKIGKKLLVTSAIDNLVKGASGQAVQNMNLMCGLDETAGLRLKPSGF
ncbi:MAG: N-acetyl-gamma-glutamyl-phosphate reductase [Prevotellaceae bacterium]|jgi:N-acetyl-gamma-glutamyl-phosphate reductase|nr:N-acetyl-gamma-glutamyl-phosphate reductase [Prevotellaceae bacterium]